MVFLGLLFFLSLVTFSQKDPSLNHAVSGTAEIRNWAGVFGAYASGLLGDLLGISSYFLSLGIFGLAVSRSMPDFEVLWWRWLGLLILALCVAAAGSFGDLSIGEIRGGGICGAVIAKAAVSFLSVPGAVLTWIFFVFASLYMVTGISWLSVIRCFIPAKKQDQAGPAESTAPTKSKTYAVNKIRQDSVAVNKKKSSAFAGLETLFSRLKGAFKKSEGEKTTPTKSTRIGNQKGVQPSERLALTASYSGTESRHKTEKSQAAGQAVLNQEKNHNKMLPGLDVLTDLVVAKNEQNGDELEAKGKDLMDCLDDFSIQGKLLRIVPGPIVTMFEIKPAPGVKVSRIASLADDIALAMKALAVRVQAPIPGTDAVGIEIPNDNREMVSFKEVLGSPAFIEAKSILTMGLGKDITGEPAVADLAKMPHLLVAGATGAGKSVCLNSILISLLFKATPEELKFLLIDPKRIELAVYADLPHLVHPVVTEMSEAKSALEWAVHEMDKRYEAIAQLGVRNLAGYNEKLAQLKIKQPETVENLEPMPYLVIIIDELADLMLTAGKEVEVAIVRLAQLARAAGIHLIIATQRPSVDVVTGLIKANFPCRISFQVTSKHDSRTILDTVGAEHLLGKGDMLMKPGGGRMQRLHGAYVLDEDVIATVAFWKKQVPVKYDVDFNEWSARQTGPSSFGPGTANDCADDPLYGQAVEFVMEQGKASISLIQRRFRIGFNKAARFVDQMEADGVIGPADGSKPRTVIK